ncbi:acyl carrier protein, partial [Klebsiella pneumoniae]|nr:acyl carrier protein [Klebsiella pneumoniae]
RGVPSAANDTITQQTVKKRPRPEIGVPYSPATREVERVLCQILEEYLGLDRVGIDDNYAELGATSLDMVQLSGQMARHYPQVSVVSLYNHATVR